MNNSETNNINQRKKRVNITIEIVRIIRNQLNIGLSIKDIAIQNCISKRAVANLADKIQLGISDLNIIKKKGRKAKGMFDITNQITSIVRLDNALTQNGMLEILSEAGIRKSQSSISRLLKNAGLTRKRLSLVPDERNSERILDLRVLYAREIEQINVSKLVYLDETGFNLHSSSKYGYSERNTKAYIMVPANRGINISLMCAINLNGVIGFDFVDGAYNGDLFIRFIIEKLVPFFAVNRDNILILDNARFHHRQDVRLCLNQNNIPFKFLPAYSPQLNPIEEFFSSLKSRYNALRPRPRSRATVKLEICNVLNNLDYSFIPLFNRAKNFLEIALSRRHFI